jgi:Na+/H+ antiporter
VRVNAETLALLGLALGVVVIAGSAVASRTGLPAPVVLVVFGLLASLVPGVPSLNLPPDLVFLVFLPPLVYRASFLTHPRTLRRHATPLALLAVGLVLTTALTVAFLVSHLVPGVGFAQGLVLGAVVAPTDPVAASGIFGRLGAPRAVVDIVEGESLVNDATALVLYAVAVQAVLSGPPTVLGAATGLAVAVLGGVAIGLVTGLLVVLVRTRIRDVGLQLLLSLFTPYAAYILAEKASASGVLAVVTAGVLIGSRSGGIFGSTARLQTTAFWSLLDVVLNSVLFVLLGLEIRTVLGNLPPDGAWRLTGYTVAVVATVVILRLAWQLLVPPPVYRLRQALGLPRSDSSVAERVVIGWTGMRGAISLAAALAIPLTADGAPFPARALLLFLTVAVVLFTLLAQGTTLPFVLRRAGLANDESEAEQERDARLALAEIALARLDELEDSGELPAGGASPLRQVWEQTRSKLQASGTDPDDAGEGGVEVDLTTLRLDLAERQSRELDRLSATDEIAPEVARTLRREIDLQQMRLGGGDS